MQYNSKKKTPHNKRMKHLPGGGEAIRPGKRVAEQVY